MNQSAHPAFRGTEPLSAAASLYVATLGRIFIINKRAKLEVSATRCSIFAIPSEGITRYAAVM